jgi:hypothetical protein
MQSMLLAQKSQKSKLLDIRFYEMESTSRSLTDRISTIFATGRIRLTGSLAGCHLSVTTTVTKQTTARNTRNN